jgi:pimeloyl-ACP methyl ester carboxylesterase
MREGFAAGRDGTPIYFKLYGNEGPDAHLTVLCDGIGCDGYVWKYLEEALAPDQAILHWHYRGHGQTPRPRNPRHVTMPDLADDLDSILETVQDTIGHREAIVAGHSMGVQVALEFYRRHRDRVGGLMLFCGSFGTPLRTFKGRATLETALPFVRMATQTFPRLSGGLWRTLIPTRAAYELAVRVEVNRELIKKDDFFPYLEHIARVDVQLFLEMLAAAARHSARELLPAIDVPVLIVAGDRDGFTPLSLSEEMHARIPASELLVVEGGSHTAPIERPELVNERVREFIRARLGGRNGARRAAHKTGAA